MNDPITYFTTLSSQVADTSGSHVESWLAGISQAEAIEFDLMPLCRTSLEPLRADDCILYVEKILLGPVSTRGLEGECGIVVDL